MHPRSAGANISRQLHDDARRPGLASIMYSSRFRTLVLLSLALLVAAGCTKGPSSVNSISEMQWQHRVLIVNIARVDDATMQTIYDNTAELNDRDMVWFVLSPGDVRSNLGQVPSDLLADARKYVSNEAGAEVVLIGKDGGVKSRDRSLDLQKVFALIDSMPMRQREMRQNGS